jgi:hypothetical protein
VTGLSDLLSTLEHYISVALGDRQSSRGGHQLAHDLAVSNVHAPVQEALGELGSVTVLTDENTGDISCSYEVEGPPQKAAAVYVSTVLPYSAVILIEGQRYSRFVSPGETDAWASAVVACLSGRGLVVLPDEACRAKRLNPRWQGGPVPSYFEDLFYDEMGPPEDWFWVGDPEPEDWLRNHP